MPKTAYEMRISDWSSDVCSSDLIRSVITSAPAERFHMVNMKGAGRGAAVCACAFGKNGLSILLAYIPAFDRRSRPIHCESEHFRLSGNGVDLFPPIQPITMAPFLAETFSTELVTVRYILKKIRHL